MKFIRFITTAGAECFGEWTAENEAALWSGSPFAGGQPTGEKAEIKTLLAPLIPAAIVGIGLNYAKLAAFMGKGKTQYPIAFAKLPNALANPGDPILLPTTLPVEQVDYEGELAVVIGRPCRNVSKADAMDYVFGYTVANDITPRDWLGDKVGMQWFKGKSFDHFCPLGPCLLTADAVPDYRELRIVTHLNGEEVQNDTPADMLFDLPEIIEFLSADTTLDPGTVILTGSPMGVGATYSPPKFLKQGDEVRIAISGIGELANPVALGK